MKKQSTEETHKGLFGKEWAEIRAEGKLLGRLVLAPGPIDLVLPRVRCKVGGVMRELSYQVFHSLTLHHAVNIIRREIGGGGDDTAAGGALNGEGRVAVASNDDFLELKISGITTDAGGDGHG